MRISRRNRSLTLWLAVLALLLGTLAPTLSHAFVDRDASFWTEVCSVDGPRRILVDDNGEPAVPTAMSPLEHCPFCALQHTLPALPPTEPITLPEASAGADWPPLFLAADHGLFAWNSARPRGPPAAA